MQSSHDDTDDDSAFRNQRASRIPRLNWHADLKLRRIVVNTTQAADFSACEFWGETLQIWIWKAHGENWLAQMNILAGGNCQAGKLPVQFENRQVICFVSCNTFRLMASGKG
jgi:hypothetical protein